MKQAFTPNAQETHASRKARLEDRAKALEALLQTPTKPHLTHRPKGVANSSSHAQSRAILTQQRINITKELQDIKENMDKRQSAKKTKGKKI